MRDLPSYEEFTHSLWRAGNLDYLRHEGQKLLSNAAKDLTATIAVLHAARGYGKTHGALIDCCELGIKNKRMRMVFAAATREDAKKIVTAVMPNVIADAPPEVKPKWLASDHAYVFPSTGSMLVVEGADDDHGNHLRGPHAHYVVCDEAGFWRHAHYVIHSVLLPQVQRVRGRMIVQSTSPESVGHDFVRICDAARLRNAYRKFTIFENPRLTREQIQQDAEEMSGLQGDAVWSVTNVRREFLCEFVTEVERQVVPEFNYDKHVEDRKQPEFFDRYVFMDQGFVDLTHALFVHYDWMNATIVVEDEIARNHVTVSELAPIILAKEKELWGEEKVRKRISDSPPIALAEFSRQHLLQPTIVPREVRFSSAQNREPEALINRMRAMFRAGRIKINPQCVELIKQLQGGMYNERRTDFEKTPGLYHLDGLMALAYAVDGIDFATDPEAIQRKWNREDYPTERLTAPRDAQHNALAKLLPKTNQRPDRNKPRTKVKWT